MESSSIHSAVTGRERFRESSFRSTATVARISAARTTIEITMMEIVRIIGYSIDRISSILRESQYAGRGNAQHDGVHLIRQAETEQAAHQQHKCAAQEEDGEH